MSDHIQQAADVIGADWYAAHVALRIATALDAAGLLVTPEQRAVLDAAVKWHDASPEECDEAAATFTDAVDAYRAATPKDDAGLTS
jgi:hypothetical protein